MSQTSKFVIQAVKSDSNNHVFYIKCDNKPAVCIVPKTEDREAFFRSYRLTPSGYDELRDALARKYWIAAQENKSINCADEIFYLWVAKQRVELIEHATIFRSKDNKLMLIPTITGRGKQPPREVTLQQWQRLWLADDMHDYKLRLAAYIFDDILAECVEKQPTTQAENSVHSQWQRLKEKHPDAILLFRCGDFYEIYNEDAQKVASVLGITVCEEGSSIQSGITHVAGFPFHHLDTHLPKMVRAGFRVAICDQIEAPKPQLSRR